MIDMEKVRQRLVIDEGLRLKLYWDTATPPRATIGVGHNLSDKGISRQTAMDILDSDIQEAENAAEHYQWFSGISPERQGVVVLMIFNLGAPGFGAFHDTIACVAAHDWAGAAENMLRSAWAHQVGHRANVYSEIMRTGVWQA